MKNRDNQNQHLFKEVRQIAIQTKIVAGIFVVILLLILLQALGFNTQLFSASRETGSRDSAGPLLAVKDVQSFKMAEFPAGKEGEMVSFGEKLIRETYKYLGPGNPSGEVYAGNHLACGSCHLDGGTKAYAAPYVGLTAVFPIFSGREGKVATLEERINGCFERSLNGKKLPLGSKEMTAIVSYMKHLSKGVPIGERIDGQGFVKLQIPDRKANLQHGETVFKNQCKSCHQENGQGLLKTAGQAAEGYLYPPLWGDDSFNDGAGMARMLTAAKFIKGNMPLGASLENPILNDDEAYDVAAYINSFERPSKANKELDYPDLHKKPKDSAYPPYADNISQEQHKYGPFNF